MANHDVAHAVADEVDLLDAVEVVDDVAERSGVLGHVGLRARILDVEDAVAPLVVKIAAERVHRRAAPHQPVQHDHRAALHGRQAAFAFDLLQGGAALVERARGVAQVLPVQQPVVAGEHVALDAPLVEEQLVGPELLSTQGGHGNRGRIARGRLFGPQPAGQRRQPGR